MPHSYVSALSHCVFSTKGRRDLVTPDLRRRLFPYMGGIARENSMRLLAAGGTLNHVHLLLSLPARIPIAKAVQLIKGGSSKWVHDAFPDRLDFEWQEGYGAFSVGVSQVSATVRYINHQEAHHRATTFEDEFVSFLKKHGIQYDARYVWG